MRWVAAQGAELTGNRQLEVVFGRHGRVDIQGTFHESHNAGNELKFRIASEQSYVGQTLEALREILNRPAPAEGR